MNKNEIGNKISTLRKEKGYTQKQLAEKLHVTDKAISNWERGNNLPDLSILEPLANELDISVIALLGLEDHTNESISMNMVEMGIEERNRIIEEVKKDNFIIIIHHIIQMIALIIAYGLAMVTFDDFGIAVLLLIACVGFCGIGFTFSASIRNHYRIKKYYAVNKCATSTKK